MKEGKGVSCALCRAHGGRRRAQRCATQKHRRNALTVDHLLRRRRVGAAHDVALDLLEREGRVVDVAADVAADDEVVIDLTDQIEAAEAIDLSEPIDLTGPTGAAGDMGLDALDVLSDDSPS